jgi:5-methyltetrahydrofolate--homocysteine methyltransferase
MTLTETQIEMAFEWINHRMLFRQRWGYNGKGMTKEAMQKQVDEVLWPAYDRIKAKFLDDRLFEPTIIYGYWPVRSDDTTLLVFDESEGWNNPDEINTEPLEHIIGRAEQQFTFPRQGKQPHRALSDFFHSDRHDVLAMTCVSAGAKLSEYEHTLYDAGEFTEYYMVHGLGVELAEALAEIAHKQIRLDLNISENEGSKLSDVQMSKYQGARYSFGYPACPDLELNRPLFRLLEGEKHGITLSETCQIDPEQSTSALVVPNKDAMYYNL